MFKKTTLALLTASLFISTSALAISNNTITFRSEVSDETCSVAINGNQAKPVVILPTVSAKELAKGGDVAGQVTFDIGLTGCTGNTDRATKISTVFVGNQVTSNGNLGNTGDATNVEVQLLDTANKVINLTNGFKGEGDLQLKPGETEASATYTAQYYATGAASAGTVEATLQYAVSYL
ncbi:fimbrial protein [Klebsiella pneumoniae]|uniref:fimbrial protein n=1 Tax=Klebsiella pneumoniae TaxID=573 RepID=UPI00217E7099|nr:fimbrial protein [Klebsiella pneumoniae]MCS5775622.1 type 1 fimbrial protein [Klebsiella pneumoniae subsp. pneumoniae]HED9572416.1 type 1 fimbrial protein [Klebsiella pneumoniae]